MRNEFPQSVDIDDLVVVYDPRVPSDACISAMVESFRREGFQEDRPIVVREKEIDGKTGYHIVEGNRRFHALYWLRCNDPEEYHRVLPAGKVPVKSHLVVNA